MDGKGHVIGSHRRLGRGRVPSGILASDDGGGIEEDGAEEVEDEAEEVDEGEGRGGAGGGSPSDIQDRLRVEREGP